MNTPVRLAERRGRDAVTLIHRWAGLTVGLAAAYLALTGLVMLFKPELQSVVDPALRQRAQCATRMPLDEQLARARELHPAGAVRQLELAEGGLGVTIVRYADDNGVYVDACTGAMLGAQDRWGGVFGTIEKLHRLRFLDDADLGEAITGWVSVALTILLVCGGLFLWWPRSWTQFKAGLMVPRGLPGRAFDVRMHRTVGSYAAVMAIASSLAAWPMAFDSARSALYLLTRSPAPAAKPRLAAGTTSIAPADRLLATTLAAVPQGDSITIAYPRKPRDAVEVTVIERRAHPYARTMLWLDPQTGSVLRLDPFAQTSRGNRLHRWLSAFHTGFIGGMPVKLLLFFGIAAIPFLAFTGVRSWLRRRASAKAA